LHATLSYVYDVIEMHVSSSPTVVPELVYQISRTKRAEWSRGESFRSVIRSIGKWADVGSGVQNWLEELLSNALRLLLNMCITHTSAKNVTPHHQRQVLCQDTMNVFKR
jgi:hypothetical protein